jgi:hypothetical protein
MAFFKDYVMQKTAVLSECLKYRYVLTRQWGPNGRTMLVIGLNPSTADAIVDDNTIVRCMGFAAREGCDRLVVVNLFAYRATDPYDMMQAADRGIDVNGPENDRHVVQQAGKANVVLCAWGTHGKLWNAGRVIFQHLRALLAYREMEPVCLGVNADGSPKHPLYVPADKPLEVYRGTDPSTPERNRPK